MSLRVDETQPEREAATAPLSISALPETPDLLLVALDGENRGMARSLGGAGAATTLGTAPGTDISLGAGDGPQWQVALTPGEGGVEFDGTTVVRCRGKRSSSGRIDAGDPFEVGGRRFQLIQRGGLVDLRPARSGGRWWRWGVVGLAAGWGGVLAAGLLGWLPAGEATGEPADRRGLRAGLRFEALEAKESVQGPEVAPRPEGAQEGAPDVPDAPVPPAEPAGEAPVQVATPLPDAEPPEQPQLAENTALPAVAPARLHEGGGLRSQVPATRPPRPPAPQAGRPAMVQPGVEVPPRARRDDPLERVALAWRAGALEDAIAEGRASADRRAFQLGRRIERFAQLLERARSRHGLAAAPLLDEALGIVEEIGRDAPQAREVRQRLAALHVAAAGRAEAGGDSLGALRHCEQALAVAPGDPAATELRGRLAGKARDLYLEAYALHELDPAAALRGFERAARLALPGDPWADKARSWIARLRDGAAVGEGAEWGRAGGL